MLRTSMFQRQNMHPEKIPSDVMMAFLITEFPNESTKKNLISEMIYYGKIHYALDVMLPNEADTLKWGFTDKKLKWCNKNERFMWTYLIEHKQIFSSSLKDIIRYNEDGPFTTPFTKESPARTGRWIGYQIVNEYMKQNKHLTLQQLLAERDHQKILNESKYKP